MSNIKVIKNLTIKEVEEICDNSGGCAKCPLLISSYNKKIHCISENEKIKGWFIGWDYAHYGDYLGYNMLPFLQQFSEHHNKDKKWTTKEIFKDVKEVCYQIQKDIEKGNSNEQNRI